MGSSSGECPGQATARREGSAGVVEVLGRPGQGARGEGGGRAGAGRPREDSRWLSPGACVTPRRSHPRPGALRKGLCIHLGRRACV